MVHAKPSREPYISPNRAGKCAGAGRNLAREVSAPPRPSFRQIGVCDDDGTAADYADSMAIATLSGGPLDGQQIPLDKADQDELILPYTEGQIVYRRVGSPSNTGAHDGATEVEFRYVEETEPINPSDD